MSDQERAKWAGTRQQGELAFELKRAAMGGFIYMIVPGFRLLSDRRADAKALYSGAIAAVVVGFFEGMMEWNRNERRFEAQESSNFGSVGILNGAECSASGNGNGYD